MHALAEVDDDWVDAYCVLYDALWAVECALTQRYIDLRRQHQTSNLDAASLENDEALQQLYHQRSSLIISAFQFKGPITPSSDLMESLAINLFTWDQSLDYFLSRQDSLLQRRMSLPQVASRISSYGKHIDELRPYYEVATLKFVEWMSYRKASTRIKPGDLHSLVASDVSDVSVNTSPSSRPLNEDVRSWVDKMASANASLYSQPLEGPEVPIYIVDCPRLHAVPRKYLAYQLRWSDKWAYDGIQGEATFVNWKEGVQCPSCGSAEKIKCARLLEPLHIPSILKTSEAIQHNSIRSQNSAQSLNPNTTTSASITSQSLSDQGSLINSFPGRSLMHTIVSQTHSDPGVTGSLEVRLPQYTESPISPMTLGPSSHFPRSYGSSMTNCPISPLTESFGLNLPEVTGSRTSMNLPIPVYTPPTDDNLQPHHTYISTAALDSTSTRPDSLSSSLASNALSHTKNKPASRSAWLASSMRRKPTTKDKDITLLPKEPVFAFSSSGTSLLLWGKTGPDIARFDVSVSEFAVLQGCRYVVEGLEAVAIGKNKCVMIASMNTSKKRLIVFDSLNTKCEREVELEVNGKVQDISIAVSKDDKLVAVSISDEIDLFSIEGDLRRIAFHQQLDVYELREGVANQGSVPVTRKVSGGSATEHIKASTTREIAEDIQEQKAIVSRKLHFSADSQRLVVASQLSDHCIYIDVWDVTREPVSTISEHSRSFKLPPRVLNDGELTSVFYDSARRAALVTAFIGKEYPILIPFPGYGNLQNETFSTKIIAAAQSPSGSVFVVANAMTEIIQFEYTAKGAFTPRKLKKASSKISSSVFKPGAIALSMSADDVLKIFWVKDGKCMLRIVKLGMTETIQDVDIRSQYDALMNSRVIAKAPSLNIAELDAGEYV
jgi:hypothetical protein